MAVTPESQYLKSSFYEQLVEHVFISEILQESWFGFGKIVEVLRSEVDASGYDLVLECSGIIRHVQLKTSGPKARVASQKVNIRLAEKPGGCVVWVVRHRKEGELRMNLSYRFFGGRSGEPLPALDAFAVAKHTKANAQGVKKERANIRVVPKRHFEVVDTTKALLGKLFALEGGGEDA